MIRSTIRLFPIAFATAFVGAACVTASPVTTSSAPLVANSPTSETAAAQPKRRAPTADMKRLRDDVTTIAVQREPGSPGWEMARKFCEKRLEDLGFEVIEQRFVANQFEYVNVVGEKKGTTRASEKIVLSAHYDHVYGCPGADDDASGVAAVLETARILKGRSFPRTLVAACWDLEEEGLVGSTVYAKAARERGDDIRLAVALDAVGFTDKRPNSQRMPPGLSTLAPALARTLEKGQFRADFIAVVHDPDSSGFIPAFEREAEAIDLALGDLEVSRLEQLVMNDVMRADHASFWLQGYPGILLSDSGEFRNPAYHCYNATDSPDTLDYEFLAKVTSSTAAMISDALEGKEQIEPD